ncbi:phenylalanine--tRNA ligase subunit beta [Aliifodinibius salipaludis]|uniref:Phenylalanine--tRNA ligase beta subunit n=1 Tax=Fodinibius salipaludis TaxID=2032627 RepID=A0A2A2GA89_9BACT|nr:phenylalanine--tRNA ligase subunit beta [Aliifodinibius salipaludis]PAU93924.1 phenylalanine--tRNA ligase subunit beta [Aliifodinibius salipaludis]
MKISHNWLKEFVDLELSPEETAEKLTLIGLEVEEVTDFGSKLEGVVVGEVLDVSDHPNADRLRICQVDIGAEKNQIICGADNVAKGQKVPVATVDTTLPVETDNGEPFTIRKAKLRGEKSNGMICAEDELGLGEGHSGIMVLDNSLKPGTPMNEAIDLYEDFIIDIELTPNRPDAACHLGVARDLAAALNLDLNKPFSTHFEETKPLDEIEIGIESPEKCHRYVGKQVTDVTVEESPDWLQNRLKAIGVRPVNNIVDITNYVMFELGQPLHGFDADTIKGNKIVVKDFDKEITFETLDHVERNCSPGTLFICDGEEPVAIAGVMGGVDSEVSDKTQNVLIESAYFDPASIRKTAKEQMLQSDASYRFERGVDPQLQRIAAERAAELMGEIAGGTVVDACTDRHPIKTEAKELTLRKSYVNRLLGTDFSTDKIENILHGLEFELLDKDENTLTYSIPTFRPDLEREVDLIEEVGRLFDYNNIPTPKHGKFTSPEPLTDWEQLLSKAKETAKGMQFREIYSNSLMPEEDAKLLGDLDEMIHTLNPISTDMTTLRPSLLYGFLSSVAYNFNRKVKQVRFFEVGNVFEKTDDGTYHPNIKEQTNILFGLAGFKTIEHWKTDPEHYDVFDLKGPVENFLKQFDTFDVLSLEADDENVLHYEFDEQEVGRIFEVPTDLTENYDIELPVFVAEISLTQIQHVLEQVGETQYEPVSKYPAFDFDFGVVVDSHIKAGDLLKTIEDTAGDSLKELDVFDVFEGESLGENKKSIAFRLSFLDKEKTLTIKDVEPIINKVLKVLENKYSAKLRQ